jgi:hypothetical protein
MPRKVGLALALVLGLLASRPSAQDAFVSRVVLTNGGGLDSGASLPGTCTVGQVFVVTTTGVLSSCTATNTWTTLGGGGGGGASLTAANTWTMLQTFSAGASFTNSYASPLVADGNSGTTKTIDLSAGNEHYLTLTGNVTLTFTNPVDGGRYVLLFNTGAGSFTVTWPGTVAWAGGTAPTITAAASKVDLCTFQYIATLTTYFAACNQGY